MPTGFYFSGVPRKGHYQYIAELHVCPLFERAREPDYLQLDGFGVDETTAVSEVIQTDFQNPI